MNLWVSWDSICYNSGVLLLVKRKLLISRDKTICRISIYSWGAKIHLGTDIFSNIYTFYISNVCHDMQCIYMKSAHTYSTPYLPLMSSIASYTGIEGAWQSQSLQSLDKRRLFSAIGMMASYYIIVWRRWMYQTSSPTLYRRLWGLGRLRYVLEMCWWWRQAPTMRRGT